MVKEIKLTRGYVTLVDDGDYERLSQHKWYAAKKGEVVRAVRASCGGGKIYMHRVIVDAPNDMYVDHINHNPLDNRRANLRLCTNQQNQFNARMWSTNKSGFKGVCWHKRKKKWMAYISINKRVVFLGYFEEKEDAARVYDEAVLKHRGEFAKTNTQLGRYNKESKE